MAVFFIASTAYLQAQRSPYVSGDLTIATDTDVPSNETTLATITGNLSISGTITEFPDFAALETVEGNLTISGLTDTNLTDLANIFPLLEEVDGDLLIQNNGFITTIRGFASLNGVGGNVSIGGATSGDGNAALTVVSGFGALTSIGSDFTVSNNAALSSCCGLLRIVDASVTVGGDSDVSSNTAGCNSATQIMNTCSGTFTIRNSEGYPINETTIVRITGDITITGNIPRFPNFASLEVVEGDILLQNFGGGTGERLTGIFPRLVEVQGNITIRNQHRLRTISGFEALRSIGGNLDIRNNTALTTVSGFGAITRIDGRLIVSNNNELSSCCGLIRFVNGTAPPSGTTITPPTSTFIPPPPAGCSSVVEIKDDCPVIRTLTASPSFLNATAVAGRITFDVTANVPWEIFQLSPVLWISSIAPFSGNGNQEITIEYEENTTSASRKAILTLEATDAGFESIDISLTQSVAVARVLLVSPSSRTPTAAAGNVTFDVNANVPWEITQRVPCHVGLVPFRPNRETIVDELPSLMTKILPLQAEKQSLRSLPPSQGRPKWWTLPSPKRALLLPSNPLGLPTLANNIRFYPNPASQTLYIEGISQETSLIIRTFSGQTLLRTTLRQNEAIDLASLHQGVYLLTLQSGQESGHESGQEQTTTRLVIGF